MQNGRWRASYLIGLFATATMLGLVAVKFYPVNLSALLAVSLLSSPLILRAKFLSVIPIVFFGMFLGLFRGQYYENQLSGYEPKLNEEVSIAGTVQSDPVYEDRGQTEFFVSDIRLDDQTSLPGRIKVRTYNSNHSRGDLVQVSGKLREGFASWQGSIYYAQTETLEKDEGVLNKFRQKFIAAIYSAIPDPESSLGLGFLIGIRTLLPEDLVDQLSRTGLTHIVAVSGYNLTVLVLLVRRIFARYSRFNALFFSLALLGIFLVITGSSPSIVRASVVSLLSLTAWYYGRSFSAVNLLLISAAITGYANPLYIWGDIGWYLSFLAFFGVLVLAPLIVEMVYKERRPGLLGQIVIETTMAQIMTAPLIMLVFKQVSLISLAANLIILPLIPIAMLLTFITGIMYMITGLAFVAAIPTTLVLSFITNSIAFMSKVPWALSEISITSYQFALMIFLTLALWALLALTMRKRRLTEEKSAIILSETE